MSWHKHFDTSWFRSDGACAAMPHDHHDNVTGNFWLAWGPCLSLNPDDEDSAQQVMRRRFKTREAAMAHVDKTWPLEGAA